MRSLSASLVLHSENATCSNSRHFTCSLSISV